MVNRHKLLLVSGLIAGLAIVAVVAGKAALGKPLSSFMQRSIVQALHDRFDSDVSFSSLKISLFPRFTISGTGLVFRLKGRTDVPPLITIEEFSLRASISGLLRSIPHFGFLSLNGLEIHIPPKTEVGEARTIRLSGHLPRFIIDEIISSNAQLDILPKSPNDPPLTFLIHDLKMSSFRSDAPAQFHATLSNPRPEGEIETDGEFGPWDSQEPSLTPVRGKYDFTHADMATFPGLAGILSSKGEFDGVLNFIQVDGATQIPDFNLTGAGIPVPMNTQFSAIVDGTNGHTLLKQVRVQILGSTLVTWGDVAKILPNNERAISLDVVSKSVRIEDLLQLTVKSPQPLLTGSASIKAKFDLRLRQGEDIFNRLTLIGSFGVGGARFSSADVQGKINAMSHRGRGEPTSTDNTAATSNFNGSFILKGGVIRFSKLTFGVRGALVSLKGSYDLRSQEINFHGALRLQAKLSQTTTGVRSLLLKMVDPMFEKDGAGALLPIRVTGTRNSPSFGLELRRANANPQN